ncbi:TRAP transporter large permease [Puniceibacterium sp. IMCC21224]|uniref:TRAP transporter large permease n=1 Tax=Puniceibacterium sp. IMCC21224 TaxID=1618204 RepID=UPI00064D9A3B|nr:TRAP transporter large permease [Puniceibacterium sp. IMCC21224]KMK66167.1 TRAP transporter, DctM subunit [Puniceibacterium sp. IMCC21224]
MSDFSTGVAGILLLFVLLGLRVPVAFAMFAVGFGGITLLRGFDAAKGLLASESFTLASSAELVVVPLFILMGNVATETGMSRKLYDAAYAVIGSVRGGLASATVIGCGGFAALSGSSVASALTMGKVSLGEMDRFNYDPRLSTGAVAAGGTLGILIPPSTGFVIYAILAQESIGRLFLAGILPGLLLLGMFVLTISLLCWFNPALAPLGPRTTLPEKLRAVGGAAPIGLVIVLTIGGIYGGLFSPVEAAAVGAGLVILFGIFTGTLRLPTLWSAAKDSVVTTATVMLILISAHLMNPFLALSHIPQALGEFLAALDLPAMAILGLILLCYLVLGCFLEGFAMLVLSMPIFYPVILSLGIDPIWFGVLVVLTLEMGLISPPVGVNVFIVKSVAPKVPLGQIFRGVIPFWFAMLVTLGILIAFPSISLLLPNTMIGAQ